MAWKCPWTAEYPDGCPYCAGEMCATFDGIGGCRHDRPGRHGSGTTIGFSTALFKAETMYDLRPYMEGDEDYGPCPCFTIRQAGFVAVGRCWRVAHDSHPYGSRKSDGRCCVHVWHPKGWTGERRRQFRQQARRLRDLLDAADWYGGWALVFEPSLVPEEVPA